MRCTPSVKLRREFDIARKTVWPMLNRLRRAFEAEADPERPFVKLLTWKTRTKPAFVQSPKG